MDRAETLSNRPWSLLKFQNLLVLWHNHLRLGLQGAKGLTEGQRLRFLAMDYRDFLDLASHGLNICSQFIFVRVAGVSVQRSNLRAHCVGFAKNVDRIPAS